MTRLLLHLLALGIIVAFVLWLRLAHADEEKDCMIWAQMVERMEAMTPAEIDAQRGAWLKDAQHSPLIKLYVGSALNWIDQGGTSKQAWQECGDI